jgi:hypothetical protein
MTKALDENTFIKRRAELAARLLGMKMPVGFSFDMGTYKEYTYIDNKNVCGTSGCIAGLAIEMFHPDPKSVSYITTRVEAAKILGLDYIQAYTLFVPSNHEIGDISYSEITEKQAGRILAKFVKTDEIDWSVRDTPVKIGKRIF